MNTKLRREKGISFLKQLPLFYELFSPSTSSGIISLQRKLKTKPSQLQHMRMDTPLLDPPPPPPALPSSILSSLDLDFLNIAGMSSLALMIVYFIYTCYEHKYSQRQTAAAAAGGGEERRAAASTAVMRTKLFQYGERGIEGRNADCSICLDEFSEGQVCRMLPKCKHIFHRFCIDQWLPNQPHCPLCRSPVRVRIVYSNQS